MQLAHAGPGRPGLANNERFGPPHASGDNHAAGDGGPGRRCARLARQQVPFRVTADANDTRDFFVSFNKADRAWATWLAWTLEDAGYTVLFQDWDFAGNFVLKMDQAIKRSR